DAEQLHGRPPPHHRLLLLHPPAGGGQRVSRGDADGAVAVHRLVYLCDWLPPDFGAVGQYSLLFAREGAARGAEVVVAGLSSATDSVEEEAVGAGRLRIVRLRARTY